MRTEHRQVSVQHRQFEPRHYDKADTEWWQGLAASRQARPSQLAPAPTIVMTNTASSQPTPQDPPTQEPPAKRNKLSKAALVSALKPLGFKGLTKMKKEELESLYLEHMLQKT